MTQHSADSSLSPNHNRNRNRSNSNADRINAVPASQPWRWMRLGWADLVRCPLPGLLHGLMAAVFGGALLYLARDSFWLLAGAFSGFLLVAPLVATGLYAVSRALERGEQPGIATALAAWRPRDSRLVRFGLLLALAGTGWVLTSAALITSFAVAPVNSPADFLRVVVLADDGRHLFEAWVVLGSVLAAPIFVSSVVAIPLLLDRENSVLDAVQTSVAAVLASPVALALWAILILGADHVRNGQHDDRAGCPVAMAGARQLACLS